MSNMLLKGEYLENDRKLTSANGKFEASISRGFLFVMAMPRNLIEWYDTSLHKHPDDRVQKLTLTHEGALIALGEGNAMIWEIPHRGDHLLLDDDGILKLMDEGHGVVWQNVASYDYSAYFVFLMGRRAHLKFSESIEKHPTSATIELYGLDQLAVMKTFHIVNGSWTDAHIFNGSIIDFSDSYSKANGSRVDIQLKFDNVWHDIIGIVGARQPQKYDTVNNTYLFGYLPARSYTNLEWQFIQPEPQTTATVMFDKSGTQTPQGYDISWYKMPKKTTIDGKFKAVTLFDDQSYREIGLYRFPDNFIPENEFQYSYNSYKLCSFRYETIAVEIAALLGMNPTDLNDNLNLYDSVKTEIVSLLINLTLYMFPSTYFGLSSSGHGSRFSLLNFMLCSDALINKCFSWVKELRGCNIDFIDNGTNCNVASFANAMAITPYVTYWIASDLERSSPDPAIGNRPEDHYDQCYSVLDPGDNTGQTIVRMFSAMMSEWDTSWNSPEAVAFYNSPAALTSGHVDLGMWKQSLTLFKCAAFAKILSNVDAAKLLSLTDQDIIAHFSDSTYGEGASSLMQADLCLVIKTLYPNYTEFDNDWKDFAIKHIDNKRSLVWDTNFPNGMLLMAYYN